MAITTDFNDGGKKIKTAQELETKEDRRKRLMSIYIAHAGAFVYGLAFSIVITAVFPYLRELMPTENEENLLANYGLLVAINPIGQTIFSPIMGWIVAKFKNLQLVLIVSALTFIAGNILYSIVTVLTANEEARFWILFTARFMVGAASGNLVYMSFSRVNRCIFMNLSSKYCSLEKLHCQRNFPWWKDFPYHTSCWRSKCWFHHWSWSSGSFFNPWLCRTGRSRRHIHCFGHLYFMRVVYSSNRSHLPDTFYARSVQGA